MYLITNAFFSLGKYALARVKSMAITKINLHIPFHGINSMFGVRRQSNLLKLINSFYNNNNDDNNNNDNNGDLYS